MTTGANFKVINGRVQWWEPLISGDELLIQDHEERVNSRQGSYRLYLQYGNPYVNSLSAEISETERNLRLVAEMKECTLQDPRFNDCIVDTTSIVVEQGVQTFNYDLIKADGGVISESFSGTT